MSAHAILSPSASHRWLNCTAAPSLEATMPDETSVYAEEGTLAHAICEAKLHELNGDGKAEDFYASENGGEAWTEHPLYKPEMEETSDYYRDVVAGKLYDARQRSADARLLIEQRLDFSTWLPQGFGTVDCCIVADGIVEVVDYKHGKGVKVDAPYNSQMMIYALGACEFFDVDFFIKTVRMTIIQPRIDNVSEWELPYSSLKQWGSDVLHPKAVEAFNGTLGCETVTMPGTWCKFCKVKAICRARVDVVTELLTHESPRLLGKKELAELLPKTAIVKSWVDDIENHALGLAMAGETITGYKVVEGRSLRKVKDSAGLIQAMRDKGIEEERYYKPRELRPLSELERLMGKGGCDAWVEKPKGKPTLVPESDKRKAWSSIDDDFGDIINNID